MTAQEIRLTDPVETLAVEQALALARELRQTCPSAPHGQALAQAESVALGRGRERTRRAPQAVLSRRAAAVGNKGRRGGPAPARAPATTKARRPGR